MLAMFSSKDSCVLHSFKSEIGSRTKREGNGYRLPPLTKKLFAIDFE